MKRYKIIVSDSFLKSDSRVFCTDSLSEFTTYLTSRKEQMRILFLKAEYTTENRDLYLCAPAFTFVHMNILEKMYDDALLNSFDVYRDISREYYDDEDEDMMIYVPLDTVEAKNEKGPYSFISDTWQRYLIFDSFIIAVKDLFSDLGDKFIDYLKEHHQFKISCSKKKQVLQYLEYGKIEPDNWSFSS